MEKFSTTDSDGRKLIPRKNPKPTKIPPQWNKCEVEGLGDVNHLFRRVWAGSLTSEAKVSGEFSKDDNKLTIVRSKDENGNEVQEIVKELREWLDEVAKFKGIKVTFS